MEGGDRQVTRVVIREGESPESLLKRFRKRVTADGILSTVKKKRFFVSKSELRRLAKRKAVRRERRRQWREERQSSRS
jgi:small subunit ribosomal protein S21